MRVCNPAATVQAYVATVVFFLQRELVRAHKADEQIFDDRICHMFAQALTRSKPVAPVTVA